MNARLRRPFFSPRLLWLWPVRNHITFPVIILFFLPALILTTAVLSCLPGAPSAPGCPGGIRSSGPTPTGSCWRTCQSPPNPLARFRAVATVRCVKTPGLQRPFRSRRLCRAVACALGIPAKGRRDVRRNAVSQTALHVVAAGPLPVVVSGAIHLFKPPVAGGHRQPQPSPPVQGVKCTSRKTFCPEAGKNFCGLPPGQSFPAVAVMPPCGEGSQTGDGEYRREQRAGPRKTSKPRLPKLNR